MDNLKTNLFGMFVGCSTKYLLFYSLKILIRSHKSINSQSIKDKQWYAKHYRENRRSSNMNTLKFGDEHRCSGRVSSSCFTSVTLSKATQNLKINTRISRTEHSDIRYFLWQHVYHVWSTSVSSDDRYTNGY
jgi:hypothetical protein